VTSAMPSQYDSFLEVPKVCETPANKLVWVAVWLLATGYTWQDSRRKGATRHGSTGRGHTDLSRRGGFDPLTLPNSARKPCTYL
jgi:hypothetical protein